MMARYRSWALLIIVFVCQVALLGVSDHCVKKTNLIPCPHEYIGREGGGRQEGGGGDDDGNLHHRGPNTNKGWKGD